MHVLDYTKDIRVQKILCKYFILITKFFNKESVFIQTTLILKQMSAIGFLELIRMVKNAIQNGVKRDVYRQAIFIRF